MFDVSKGIINKGNSRAIAEFMNRALNGESLTTAFLGGSITEGFHSSTPETCYAYNVYRWFTETFPKAQFKYINAGIGGTTSQFGVARVREHVLSHKPDFVLTEFAVNDDNNDFFLETYEGLVRSILSEVPALILMNNVCYNNGVNAEEKHLQVAKHYDVPMVSMKSTIWPEVSMNGGPVPNEEITPDNIHPNDKGHRMVADVIIYALELIKDKLVNEGLSSFEDMADSLPAPITKNRFDNSVCIHNDAEDKYIPGGFVKDTRPKERFADIFSCGFIGEKQGDKVTFKVTGKCIAAQYKRTYNVPVCKAVVTVDGDTENAVILDGNFDETWICLAITNLYQSDEVKEHTVEIKICDVPADMKEPFYLVSLICA